MTSVAPTPKDKWLSDAPLPVDPKVEEKLVVARVGLLMQQPFWGNLATRLELVEASHVIPTAATDGRKLYYNQNFVRLLNVRQTQFLFGHEVGHCVFDHFSRLGDRDPQLWNYAGDYVINGILVEGNVGELITVIPPLLDARYKDMYTEEVYDLLYAKAQKMDLNLVSFDDHLEVGDAAGSEGENEEGAPLKGRPVISKEEAKQLKDEFREAVINAAHAAGAGNVPGSIRRMIQEFTEPKICWRDLLHSRSRARSKATTLGRVPAASRSIRA